MTPDAPSASRIGPGSYGDQASRLRAIMGQSGVTPIETSAWRRAGHAGVPIVAITSGKGGVGKTNLAVNLAIAISARRVRVTLLDADLGMANTDVLLGLTPTRRIDAMVEAAGVTGRASLASLCIEAPGGFRLIPGSAGVARMADLPNRPRAVMIDALSSLAHNSDVVLIDTGAGAHGGVTSFVRAADLALVVATPEPTSIADAYAMIKCLTDGGRSHDVMPRVALVVNQASGAEEAAGVHARIAAVSARFLGASPALFGWVPTDPNVSLAVRARTPFVLREPRTPASVAMARLAEEVSSRLLPHSAEHSPNADGWFVRFLRRFESPRPTAPTLAR